MLGHGRVAWSLIPSRMINCLYAFIHPHRVQDIHTLELLKSPMEVARRPGLAL